MRLPIFSCAYWSFVYFLWINIFSNLLSTFLVVHIIDLWIISNNAIVLLTYNYLNIKFNFFKERILGEMEGCLGEKAAKFQQRGYIDGNQARKRCLTLLAIREK